MNNVTWGIITILFCLLGYFLSYKEFKSGRVLYSLAWILICGLALRMFTGMDFYLHEWDEKYHALVAKNLLNHPLTPTLFDVPIFDYDFENWSGNHIWVSKPIFPLWLMSGSVFLFGENELAIRLPSLVLSIIGIFLTYKIGELLYNEKVGLLASFLHSINGLLIEVAAGRVSSDHVETAFVFFVQLGILFSILSSKRRAMIWDILAGATVGIALLCKLYPGLIILPIWLCSQIFSSCKSIKVLLLKFLLMMGVCLIVVAPWLMYMHVKYPMETQWMLNHMISPFSSVLEDHSGDWWYYLNDIRIVYGELIYIPLLWFTWFLLKNKKSMPDWVVFIWWLVPLVIFSAGETKRQTYMLIFAPAIFLTAASFIFNWCGKLDGRWSNIGILILFLGLPVRYCIERVKPFESLERERTWVAGLKNLNVDGVSKPVLLNTSRYIEAMFYNNCTAYWFDPTKEQITLLKEKGYTIFVCTNDSLQTFEKIE